MVHKIKELEEMMEDLEKVVQNQSPIHPDDVECGKIVAAQVLNEKAIPYYARAVIRSSMKGISLTRVIIYSILKIAKQ